MPKVAEQVLFIDDSLRFVLYGLECALKASFSNSECDRVFQDADGNQVSAKDYVFYRSRRLAVTARVDEYEPETIWVRIEGIRNADEWLGHIIDRSNRWYLGTTPAAEIRD